MKVGEGGHHWDTGHNGTVAITTLLYGKFKNPPYMTTARYQLSCGRC